MKMFNRIRYIIELFSDDKVLEAFKVLNIMVCILVCIMIIVYYATVYRVL